MGWLAGCGAVRSGHPQITRPARPYVVGWLSALWSPRMRVSSSVLTQLYDWVEDTERIWVVDSEAWTERVPIYDSREFSICNICGADITGHTAEHGKAHMLAGEGKEITSSNDLCEQGLHACR